MAYNNDSYNLNRDTIIKLISPLFNENINRENIISLITHCLSSYNIELLINIMHSNVVYNQIRLKGFVKILPKDIDTPVEIDVLNDLGLLFENKYVLGIITGDDGYTTEDEKFDPYYLKMKVELLLHDDKRKFKKVNDCIMTKYLQALDLKTEIKLIKHLETME